MSNPTPVQLKLATALLYKSGEKFANHCCNDFNLIKDGGLTVEEAREIQELVESHRYIAEQGDADLDSPHGDDWVFMCAVAEALRERT